MKRKAMMIVLLCQIGIGSLQSQAGVVFDPTNWLVAIDQMYASYDMVMNTIQQIEQAYEQYQHFVEQAKSWDFDDIQWDGDWDFRDEISDVTKSVNKQITNLRNIEELFTIKQYTVGGMAFTFKDLIGLGDDNKDIADILENVGNVSKNSFDVAADALLNGIDDKQAMAIWRKYGLSTRNFIYMQQKKQVVDDLVGQVVGAATEEAVAMQTEMNLEGANVIVSQALNPNVEHTEKELQQQIILMLNELVKNINNVGTKVDKATALTALQQTLDDEKEEQEKQKKIQVLEGVNTKQDTMFLN